MSISISGLGRLPTGEALFRYTITNASGASASFLNYGAIWQTMFVPNRKGELVDVVLGYDTVEAYQKNHMYLGATIGRVANRIKKRALYAQRRGIQARRKQRNLLPARRRRRVR